MEFNATFLVSFVSFIVFVVLMNQILYRPLDKIVRERKSIKRKQTWDWEIKRTFTSWKISCRKTLQIDDEYDKL